MDADNRNRRASVAHCGGNVLARALPEKTGREGSIVRQRPKSKRERPYIFR